MTLRFKAIASIALAAALGGCSLGGLLGGGTKGPTTLFTLTPEAADTGATTRTANAGQAVTIATPILPKELRTVRVPVQLTATDIQYVPNMQWVDTPDRLFQALVEETVRRTTSRVVLDPHQSAMDPGLLVSGELQRFGYDASSSQVVVVYDASASTAGGTRVEMRRFEARAQSDGTVRSVAPALNQAANQVATQVAQWIGNSAG
jgi:cholesterol transport system auxiliary component